MPRAAAHALSRRVARRRGGDDDGRRAARAVRDPYGRSDLGPRTSPPTTLLASCYRKVDRAGRREGLQSIAFPAISTGAYGYPKDRAAAVASKAIAAALAKAHSVAARASGLFRDADRELFVQHQQFPAGRCCRPDSPDLQWQFIASSFRGLEQCHERLRDLVSFRGCKVHPTL